MSRLVKDRSVRYPARRSVRWKTRVAGDRASPRVRSGLPRAPGPDGGVYESEAGSETRVMMTYDDGEWDGAPRRGIGRRDATFAPLPETCSAAGRACCVAAGTTRRWARADSIKPLAPLPEKGYLASSRHLPAEAKATAAVAHVRRAGRDVDERAQIGIGVVRVRHVKLRQVPSLARSGRAGSKPRGRGRSRRREAGVAWPMGTGRGVDSAAVPEMESDPPNAPKPSKDQRMFVRWRWAGWVPRMASSRLGVSVPADSSFPHEERGPVGGPAVESNIAVSNWFIDQVYAGTVVRPQPA